MGFKDTSSAAAMRDIITSIAEGVVDRMRPAVQIGKVYSYTPGSSTCQVLFAGETIASLVTVNVAPNLQPRVTMDSTYSTAGYNAASDVVRVAGKPGAYYIDSYVFGSPSVSGSSLVAGSVPRTALANEVAPMSVSLSFDGPWSTTAPPNGTTGVAFSTGAGRFRGSVFMTAFTTNSAVGLLGQIYIDGVARGTAPILRASIPATAHVQMAPGTLDFAIGAGTHYLYLQILAGSHDSNDRAALTGFITAE